MPATVALRAHSLLGAVLRTGTVRRPLEPADVAVVVSHNAQASVVHALLRGRDLDGITVGTADSLQGWQWAAVVALDPLTGTDGLPAYAASARRLCVMASRHYTSRGCTTGRGGTGPSGPTSETPAVGEFRVQGGRDSL